MSAAMTAGELLRRALDEGEAVRSIARRLAGERASLADIERWRAVVVRAERGSEPREEQAERVGEVFGVAVTQPERPPRITRAELVGRLERVEDALNALGPELRRLAGRVGELEQQVRSRTSQGSLE